MNKTREDYQALQAALAKAEAKTGLYLADENVDRENVDCAEASPEFWTVMYAAAAQAAGFRAEEAGLNINALIGQRIY